MTEYRIGELAGVSGVTASDAVEEGHDVRRGETLGQQLVDRLQLGEMVVVVERAAAAAARRVKQPAFAVCANVALGDARHLGELTDSILGHMQQIIDGRSIFCTPLVHSTSEA